MSEKNPATGGYRKSMHTEAEERLAELTTLAPMLDAMEGMRAAGPAEPIGGPQAYSPGMEEPGEADAMTPGVERGETGRRDGACTEVDRVARLLMAEWERVEKNPVNVSYIATFCDLARAVIADRDLKPPIAPLAIGSTWTGPDGTAVDEPPDLSAAEAMRLCEEGEQAAREYLARTRIAPAAEVDTLRGRVGELEAEAEAEVGRLRGELSCLTGSIRALASTAFDVSTDHADEALTAIERGVFEVRRREAAIAIHQDEARRLEIGEAQSQLASAHAACEASRNERDRLREAFLEIARETGAHADVIPSVLSDHAVTVIRHDAAVRSRISSLVATHIVRTTGPEPALEGLGRIELALVEQAAEIDKLAASRARLLTRCANMRRASKPKPARKAKPGKRRKGGR
jgi:uncharacterized coiled-coil protein SlyX